MAGVDVIALGEGGEGCPDGRHHGGIGGGVVAGGGLRGEGDPGGGALSAGRRTVRRVPGDRPAHSTG